MNFQDRISTNPGRVTLKNVSTGETATYDLTLADSPTQAGTSLNKATFDRIPGRDRKCRARCFPFCRRWRCARKN